MALDYQRAALIAQSYFNTPEPLRRLGWGITGCVFLSPDMRTAVKVHDYDESVFQELAVYGRLRKLKIHQVHGLTVPKLREHWSSQRLIQMDFVAPPYLLDFAGVRFEPPDFDDERLENWHAGIAEFFGPNASIAYAVYHTLSQHGLYYMDFRPSNLKLDGLPGLEPWDSTEPEDL